MQKNIFSWFLKKQVTTTSAKKSLISSLAPKVLTKKEDIEKIQPYLDKLNEAIDTEGINNIALTGGYGSGKSTIIKTFRELNPQYEFLNISLASFNKKKNDDTLTSSEKKAQKEELERLLEVSILQQIFYHVNPSEIPESRFKRIINIPTWKIWCISLGFILWVISSVLLIKYNYLDKINPSSWESKDDFDWFALIIFLIAFVSLGLFSKLVIKLFSNSKINKVNIKGELELGDNANKSVFNEHLEEILYFFEMTKHNVIVIEDLDRFDSTDIFTKLREINILLNNSKLIKREINFVYAVGDDLFEDKKERVKFFEYIIPVIPFINSSNADEQLRTLIKESGLDKNMFTNEFISDITTFIDDIDMRLLTNIFHEFIIYRKTLNPEFIKKNDELFAMITYKNIDPKDFTELNRKDGKLYRLIDNKRSYIKEFINKIDAEITLKNSQIKDIEKFSVSDIRELRVVYVSKVLSKLPTNAILYDAKITELLEDDGFEKVTSENIVYIKYNHYNGQYYIPSANTNLKYTFTQIENEINPDFTYDERVELIESKHNNKVNLLKKEIAKLKLNKSEIENWDLKQVFNEVDITEYLNDFSNNGLLRNLILNGYINENYNDYISLFHEGSITKEDFTFERNVKAGYSTIFDFKLSEKVENLVQKIDEKYFEREAILNFDLFNFLANNYNKYSNKYDSVIRVLSNEKEKSIQFIDEYIKNEERPLEIFFEKLITNWSGFWNQVFFECNYDNEKLNKYVELIIRFSKIETILKNEEKTYLIYQIEENAEFLSLVKKREGIDYFDKLTNLLKDLKIEFNKLENPNEETKNLFDYVYNNNHYRINKDNLLQMLLIFGREVSDKDFENSNYTTVLNSECKPLIKYVNSNISSYVEDVYLKLENKLENESSIIKLLNNKNLNSKSKNRIIQKLETKIVELSTITELEDKTQLLINNKVIPKWSNVIDYYITSENTINENLVKFLNFENVNLELSKVRLPKEDITFEGSLLKCNDISDETHSKILSSINFSYNKLEFENLNKTKVIHLVYRILNTTKANYDLLKEHFPNYHVTLIERDFKKFFAKISDFETDETDIELLLKAEKITIDNKFNYISLLAPEVISGSKEISKLVGNIILQKSIKIGFEYKTIEALVKNSTSSENKVRLINMYINDIENDSIKSLLKDITGYSKLFEKGKPTYPKSGFNNTLFGKLKSKNLIKNYYDDKWNDSNFRVTTNY